jgi:hypothetical protein
MLLICKMEVYIDYSNILTFELLLLLLLLLLLFYEIQQLQSINLLNLGRSRYVTV